MVEYAILLILLVTLFVGGTELGLTSLASSKNTEAAKTGISEYAEVNQQRLNILNAEKKYSLDLIAAQSSSSSVCTPLYAKDEDANNALDPSPNDGFKCTSDGSYTLQISSYVDYLDAKIKSAIEADNNLTPLDVLEEYAFRTPDAGTIDDDLLDDYDSDGNGSLSPNEISDAESNIKQDAVLSTVEKAYKLILIQHLKLALLPILIIDANNDVINLSDAKLLLADLNALTITPPSCGGTDGAYTYDDGLPSGTRYIYKTYLDKTESQYIYQSGYTVYLFNPLPIDVDSCAGVDNQRGGKPRIRILIDGYTPPKSAIEDPDDFNDLFVPGLPKLNQAMYSNYENVCVAANNSYVSCSSSDVAQRWLKPPGKICFNNTEVAGVDSCIGQPNTALEALDSSYGPTGFYFFANANDASTGSFEYTQNDSDRDNDGSVDFSPTLQLECSSTPNKESDSVFDANCTNIHTKVRIHTRYRRVFEGFLTFGLQTLTQPAPLPYFYNPNQVGVADHVVIGSHGSEVGPLGRGGNPTIKQFMDFRGCYEVDVETNQVSACN